MSRSSSPSSASTLSCINVDTSGVDLASSTPPTSVTDAGSISSKSFGSKDDDLSTAGRARRARTSNVNYNENVLSGRPIIRKAKGGSKSMLSDSQQIDADSSIDARRLLSDSIAVLDLAWDVDGLAFDQQHDAVKTKKSIRSRLGVDAKLLQSASSMVGKTTSILGKRARDAMENGVGRMQALGKRTSLRVKQQIIRQEEGSAEKKIKITQETVVTEKVTPSQSVRKPVRVPATKRWLAKGLYVGQDADFDPRMTDAKNKLKQTSSTKPARKQRKILPLPMFAGKRLLETGRPFRLPFDVFNPLPNGQPKPEEWRKVGKNVFVGDSGEIWRHTKLTEMSKCLCTLETGCDDDCINRTMFYECDDSNCNVGPDHCGNRSFEGLRKRVKAGGKYNIGVEVVKTKDKGYGVRSNRTFEPYQIIVEYTGEIITPEECDVRMYNEYKDNECFYLMVFDQNMIIDATRGSIARFVNHSCEPNCAMVKWTVAGKPRMALFAGEAGIMTGEELTYDYNFDPFSTKNIQDCRCGKPSCRGILGRKPKEAKEVKEVVKPAVSKPSTKRKLQEAIGKAAQSAGVKKRKMAVSKSMKKALSSVKVTATKQLSRAAGKKAPASRKMSDRSSKPINRAKAKRTNVRFRKQIGKTTPVKAAAAAGSPQKHARAAASGTVKRGVVRTMKGKTGGGRGRTIKVIAAT